MYTGWLFATNAWNQNASGGNAGNQNNNNKNNNNRVRPVRRKSAAVAGPDVTTAEVLGAYLDCRKRKRGKDATTAFELDLVPNLTRITRQLREQTWRPGTSMCFAVTVPKPREIWAANFADRVVHHVIYNRLRPRFEPRFLPTSFACIPGRGTLAAKRWAEQAMRRVTCGWSRPAWALQLDVANFFPSIDHKILLDLLAPALVEPWLDTATRAVITHDIRVGAHLPGDPGKLALVPPHKSLWNAPPGKGLPIGNLTSQFAANIYMDVVDQHIVRRIRPRFYGRYVDDMLLIDPDKGALLAARDQVGAFLTDTLALNLHPGKTRLQPATHGVDWIGFVIKPHRTYLRRSTATRARHNIAHAPDVELLTTTNSYLGIAAHADTWTQRGTWCAAAAARGLVPAPDRSKVMARPIPKGRS